MGSCLSTRSDSPSVSPASEEALPLASPAPTPSEGGRPPPPPRILISVCCTRPRGARKKGQQPLPPPAAAYPSDLKLMDLHESVLTAIVNAMVSGR